jgi:hypothetical protein
MKTLHKINDRYVALAMKQYGSSFVMRLGDAVLHADSENLQIIKNSFPTIRKFYTKAVQQDLIEFAAKKLHIANFDTPFSIPNPPPDGENPSTVGVGTVFKNCNVCRRSLRRRDEFAAGMCAICANEEIPE